MAARRAERGLKPIEYILLGIGGIIALIALGTLLKGAVLVIAAVLVLGALYMVGRRVIAGRQAKMDSPPRRVGRRRRGR